MRNSMLFAVVLLGISAGPAAAQTATATAASASPGRPEGTPEEVRTNPLRGSGSPGKSSPLNIQIHGGGIALPPSAEKQECKGADRDGNACRDKAKDPVAERIDQGLERKPGAVQPLDVKVQGTAVETPRCFGESRDSQACK